MQVELDRIACPRKTTALGQRRFTLIFKINHSSNHALIEDRDIPTFSVTYNLNSIHKLKSCRLLSVGFDIIKSAVESNNNIIITIPTR